MSFIVLQNKDGSIKAVPDSEWRQNPIPLGKDGWFVAEVIEADTPEQAIWKASRSDISDEIAIAADFLKAWLEVEDWLISTDAYLQVCKLVALIQEVSPESDPLSGLIAVTDENGDVLLLAEEEWEQSAEQYNRFHDTTWEPCSEEEIDPDQLELAL